MALSPSQIATLRNVVERPGRLSVATIGADYANSLQLAGYITIKDAGGTTRKLAVVS